MCLWKILGKKTTSVTMSRQARESSRWSTILLEWLRWRNTCCPGCSALSLKHHRSLQGSRSLEAFHSFLSWHFSFGGPCCFLSPHGHHFPLVRQVLSFGPLPTSCPLPLLLNKQWQNMVTLTIRNLSVTAKELDGDAKSASKREGESYLSVLAWLDVWMLLFAVWIQAEPNVLFWNTGPHHRKCNTYKFFFKTFTWNAICIQKGTKEITLTLTTQPRYLNWSRDSVGLTAESHNVW